MATSNVSEATLEAAGEGHFRVSGVLDAATAPDILARSDEAFRNAKRLDVDLAGVSDSDSAGLALLIEWLRAARQRGQQICFSNVPAQIDALARISEVEDLLKEEVTGD